MKQKLNEKEDFYFNEQGFYVMTEKYHLERGFCCSNGCKHCPYNFVGVPEVKRSEIPAKKEKQLKK